MAITQKRVVAHDQPANERIKNFKEVCYGYTLAEAIEESKRCIQCKKPRCITACPVQIKIPDFIKLVSENDIIGAADIIAQDSSLPAVCGRVCPQETQCEGVCVVGIKGEPVSIGKLERFVADKAREINHFNANTERKNNIKVAVIGSGPAGLACASDLARMGYYVKIFEALHKAGGVLEYGIPEFRLPKNDVVQYEIDNVKSLGVEIETDVVVGRTVTIDQLMEDENFKAVFIASGAGLPKFMNIPGENLNGVVSANELLTRTNLMKAFNPEYDTPVYVGKRVVVVGGGNVAMDAARTAIRLGANVDIVYRRSEKELPARVEEVHHAKEEGVVFNLLCNPIEIIGDEKGWVKAIKAGRMQLGEPDEKGRRKPLEIPNSEFIINCDVVVMSLGTSPNPLITATTPNLEAQNWGGIIADEETGATSRLGVFAGGDAVTGAATVILAMGAGRKAAKAIDNYLKKYFNTLILN